MEPTKTIWTVQNHFGPIEGQGITVMLSILLNKLPWLNDVNPTDTSHHKLHSIPNEFEGAVPTRFQCPYPNYRLFCVGNIGIGL